MRVFIGSASALVLAFTLAAGPAAQGTAPAAPQGGQATPPQGGMAPQGGARAGGGRQMDGGPDPARVIPAGECWSRDGPARLTRPKRPTVRC